MALTKPKLDANYSEADHKLYPTWEAFVQANVEQTNELLSQLDQDAIRKLIDSKTRSVLKRKFEQNNH